MVAVFVYKLDDRWRLSTDYEQKDAWLFTKGPELNDDTTWYTFGEMINKKTGQKKKYRRASTFKIQGLKDANDKPIFENICELYF